MNLPDRPVRRGDEAVPPRPGATGVVAVALTGLGYLGTLLAAGAAHPGAFVLALVLVVAGEAWSATAAPLAGWTAGRLWLTLPWRWSLVSMALLLLVARRPDPSPEVAGWLVASSLVAALTGAALEGAATAVAHWRKSPVLSRGLHLSDLTIPPSPTILLRWGGQLGWPVLLVLLGGTALGLDGPLPTSTAAVLGAVAMAVSLALLAWAAALALSAYRADVRASLPPAVQDAITALAPDVVLYFGGRAPALYQVEMWLPTLERSGHRPLVLVRDREAWRRMRPTALPVVCVPADTVLTGLDLGTVRAALFVANGATNIHLLRMGGMRTAFIGHGDSDKASSSNPFVKVYDEIWVAGPAGATRYARADTRGIADLIRVVGRPQAEVGGPRPVDGAPLTVVYAPTWEGWGDEEHHSSLPHDGAAIVRLLLDTPGVRVVYRPHPLTGTRDAAVRRAHREVLAFLRTAGAPARPPVARSTTPRGDDVDRVRGEGPAAGPESSDAFWRDHDATLPRIAEGDWPGLSSVLDHADLLVCDISGVLSDWIAKDRPLAVTNPAGLAPELFAERYPSSRAGLLLGGGGEGLAGLVDQLLAGQDPTAADRAQVSTELLGEPDPAGTRFEAALDSIVERGAPRQQSPAAPG